MVYWLDTERWFDIQMALTFQESAYEASMEKNIRKGSRWQCIWDKEESNGKSRTEYLAFRSPGLRFRSVNRTKTD